MTLQWSKCPFQACSIHFCRVTCHTSPHCAGATACPMAPPHQMVFMERWLLLQKVLFCSWGGL